MSSGYGAIAGALGAAALGSLASTGYSTMLSSAATARQAKRSYNYQRLLNQQAYDLTQQGYREAYGNIRTGLENAGYNPMLAVNSASPGQFSGGSASSPTISAGSPDIAGMLNGVSNAYKAFQLDTPLNEATVENLKATTENTNAKTVTEGYNQNLLESQRAINLINYELYKKDLDWKDRMYLMEEKTGYMNALSGFLSANAQELQAHTAEKMYSVHKYNAFTDRYKYRLDKYRAQNDYWKNYSEIRFGRDMEKIHSKSPEYYYGHPGRTIYYGHKSMGL